MRHTTAMFLLFLLGSVASGITGATVQNVTLDGTDAKITILNQSNRDITGFTISIESSTPDGIVIHSEYTEDYGPLTGTTLRAHESVVETYHLTVQQPTVPTVKVIVAIYKDGTAEAEEKETLDQILSVRAGIARALRLSALTLNTALSKPKPSDYARVRLEQKLAENDPSVDRSYLRAALAVIKRASNNDNGNFILQENAARYSKEAVAFESYANVRRLQ